MSAPTRLCFLNEEHDLDRLAGWDDATVSKLWRYNLHYFDDLTAERAGARRHWHLALIDRWVRENPPGRGSGWEPYPCSLRIVNWIRWSLSGTPLPAHVLDSLAVQARWLSRRLEHHLLGNHLWANAKALVFAGTFFKGREAQHWRTVGLALLERELAEQLLSDGGHFERSPMYHAIVLSDLLDLCALDSAVPDALPLASVRSWRTATPRMLQWLQAMTHPDGDIALFNDAVFDVAPTHAQLRAYAEALGIRIENPSQESVADLAASGYVRMARGPSVVLADVGPVGPDYIPGHAHADTLSFELSVHGYRVIVDSGTSRYDVSAERLRERGTAAHNTVQINGQDSSEVWSSFRVARRASPFGKHLAASESALELSCAHDGYRRLPGRPVHRRRWRLNEAGLTIWDEIEGPCDDAVARYHLHPAISIELACDDAGVLKLPNGRRIRWSSQGAAVAIADATFNPRFNGCQPSKCLELRLLRDHCEFQLIWQ